MKKHVRLQIAMATGVRCVKFESESMTQSRTNTRCPLLSKLSNTWGAASELNKSATVIV